MNKNFACLHELDAGYQCDCVDCYEKEIDRLRSENAALTAERDHARQDAATVRLQLAEKQRPFTVTVEIPNINCCDDCPLDKWACRFSYGNYRPGPGCPRYKGGKE